MNSALITLALIVGLPVVVLLVLRINATLVFLSLCLGDVLTQFVAGDTNSFMSVFKLHGSQVTATSNNIKLALLLLPVVLTAIFMIRTVRGKSKQFLNLLPAAGVGLLGALLIVPLLPGSTAASVMQSSLWGQLARLQDLIVGMSALFCLLVLWVQRPKTGSSGEKHGKHAG